MNIEEKLQNFRIIISTVSQINKNLMSAPMESGKRVVLRRSMRNKMTVKWSKWQRN